MLNERLEDYKHSIERALAGALTGKKENEINDADVEQAKELTSKFNNLSDYMDLADAIDREDVDSVFNIVGKYGIQRGSKTTESVLRPIAESGYYDVDFLLREGFAYFGIFEDEKLREKVTRYLDENSIEYLDSGDGHLQLKFNDRESAYKAEAHIARLVRTSNPKYVRDSAAPVKAVENVEMANEELGRLLHLSGIKNEAEEQKKYVQDGGDFYDVKGHHIASAPFKVTDFDMDAAIEAEKWFNQKFPGFVAADDADLDISGDYEEPYEDLGEAKSTKHYSEKPFYVRTGGQSAKQSGAGAHEAGNKKGKIQKQDPIKGKHKKDLRGLEESNMKKLEEGVMGMADIPGLNRLLALAGRPSLKEADLPMVAPVDEPMDSTVPVIGPEKNLMPDNVDVVDATPEVGIDEPMDTGMDPIVPAPMDVAPALPAPAMDARSEIETALSTIASQAPNLKISDYKEVLSAAEDAVAQLRSLGSQYLREAKANESLLEWANRVGGFRKAHVTTLVENWARKHTVKKRFRNQGK
jgi:hypothetical protein